MEHRLRNKAQQPAPSFHPTPAAKQNDWFKQMRLSSSTDVSEGRAGSEANNEYVRSVDDDKSRFELRQSNWTLKSDLDAATRGTGLEDLFGTSFKLNDEAGSQSGAAQKAKEAQQMAGTAPVVRVATLISLSALFVAAVAMVESARRGVLNDLLQVAVEKIGSFH